MARAINPKGISGAGKNGKPPRVAVRGTAPNAREATNIPGSVGPRNTRSPGPSGKGRKKGPKPVKEKSSTSPLNISKPGGGIKVKSSRTGRSPRGRKSGAGL